MVEVETSWNGNLKARAICFYTRCYFMYVNRIYSNIV